MTVGAYQSMLTGFNQLKAIFWSCLKASKNICNSPVCIMRFNQYLSRILLLVLLTLLQPCIPKLWMLWKRQQIIFSSWINMYLWNTWLHKRYYYMSLRTLHETIVSAYDCILALITFYTANNHILGQKNNYV